MELEFTGPMWTWRGPAPHHFVTVPEDQSDSLHAVAGAVSYGWGMVPVRATVGGTSWETSLFPKDGLYVLPVKVAVRQAERLGVGDELAVRLTVPGL